MKFLKLAALLLAGLLPAVAHAATICPTTSFTNSDCGYIITIGAGGTFTGAAVSGAAAYDGSDDALIGVINNSGSVYTGSFSLTGSGDGGGLFHFENDGICTFSFTGNGYCTASQTNGTDPQDYYGPLSTYSNIRTTSILDDTGTVNITGLAAGASTFFSLESSPASIGTIVITPAGTPEPSSFLLLGTGVLGVAGTLRRRILNVVR